MYALSAQEYERWLEISSPLGRMMLRLWIDSFNMGTHVHWRASPLSVLGLAHLWEHFQGQAAQYTKRQRASVKAMARRRAAELGLFGEMPLFNDSDSAWSAFFATQISRAAESRSTLVDFLQTHLQDTESVPEARGVIASLAGNLLTCGLSSDQLFRGAKGVLDTAGYRGTPPDANLMQWLEDLRAPPNQEFIAYTSLAVHPGNQVSNELLKKWSNLRLQRVEDFRSDRTLPALLRDGEIETPIIATRRSVSGGIAELHRREARRLFAVRLQRFPRFEVLYFPPRSYFVYGNDPSVHRTFDVSFSRADIALTHIPSDTSGLWLYHRATHDGLDFPEEAIRNLLVAAELRWRRPTVRETDQHLVNAYRWGLRTRLGRELAAYLARARAIAKFHVLPVNSSYKQFDRWYTSHGKDLSVLLDEIETADDFEDETFACRLREVTQWYPKGSRRENELQGVAHTFREIDELISLCRGIRNSSTHANEAEDSHVGVLGYLGRVLIESFCAALTRESKTFLMSAASTATPRYSPTL